MSPASVVVLGIGNTLMGDDGVGVRIAEELSTRELGAPGEVEVVTGAVAGMALVGHLRESRNVIFADAIDTDADPGTVFCFDPDEAGVTQLRSNTTHGMSVSYLVTAARMAGADPNVLVYAVQVGDVRPNPDALTAAVEATVSPTADLIAEEIGRLLAQ